MSFDSTWWVNASRGTILLMAMISTCTINCSANEVLVDECSKQIWACRSCKAWPITAPERLVDVDCSHFNLTEIPLNLSSRLGALFLDSNFITDINGSELLNYRYLQILELSNNLIKFIANGTFSYLSELRELRLSGNKIGAINAALFRGLRSLVLLDLRHNAIKSITDGTFVYLTSLRQLHLAYNEIRGIEKGGFVGLGDSLMELNMRGNKLRAAQIKNLSSKRAFYIRSLDLGDNSIANIDPDTFTAFRALRQLKLDKNKLLEVPKKAVEKIKGNLLELHLSKNSIYEIRHTDFEGLTALRSLYINETNVSVIYQGAFERLLSLKHISVEGNPFSCDCRLRWFRVWLGNKHGIMNSSSSAMIKCADPQAKAGEEILKLEPDSFVCVCSDCVKEAERCFQHFSRSSCICNDTWSAISCSGVCAEGNVKNANCAYILGECRCGESCLEVFGNETSVSECKCPTGFMENQAGDCSDVNECNSGGNNICGMYSKCINTHGSYRCVCKEGYIQVSGVCEASGVDNLAFIIVGSVIVSAAVLAVVVCLVYYLLWRSRYKEDPEASVHSVSTKKENGEELQTLNPALANASMEKNTWHNDLNTGTNLLE